MNYDSKYHTDEAYPNVPRPTLSSVPRTHTRIETNRVFGNIASTLLCLKEHQKAHDLAELLLNKEHQKV